MFGPVEEADPHQHRLTELITIIVLTLWSTVSKNNFCLPNIVVFPLLGSASNYVPAVCNGREVVDSTTSSL